jgi:hypothetical protein
MEYVLGIGTSLMVEKNKKFIEEKSQGTATKQQGVEKGIQQGPLAAPRRRNVSIEVRMSKKPSSEAAANEELMRTVTVR